MFFFSFFARMSGRRVSSVGFLKPRKKPSHLEPARNRVKMLKNDVFEGNH